MAEHWTCIECSTLYDDSDGDTDEKMMCNKCIDEIKTEKDIKNDLYGTEVYGKIERRDPNIRRSSTVHYPDWDMKKKEYVVPPNQRRKQCPKCKSDHPVHTIKDLSDGNWHELKDGSTTIIPDPFKKEKENVKK